MAGVKLSGLRKQFQNAVAVEDVSLDIADGEFIALLGPSGCGKTTTLRMVAGFESPTAGEIRVGDRIVSAPGKVVPPEKRRMSMIFQSYAIWPHLTVFDNVAFGLTLVGVGGDVLRRRVDAALRIVRLDGVAGRFPGQLSGGQQQRVSLARALVVEPETLLLDEPLSNLDASLREEMRFEIRRLHDEFDITSIYVTHDQSEAMVTADRIVVMNAGRIEQVGTAEDIYDRPQTRFVASFIGTNNVLDCAFEDGTAMLGGRPIAVDAGCAPARMEARALVAIRPHEVRLMPASGGGAPAQPNALAGQVRRASFLGDVRDYLVVLPGQAGEIRAVTRPGQRFAVGDDVEVALPRQHCRYVRDTPLPRVEEAATC